MGLRCARLRFPGTTGPSYGHHYRTAIWAVPAFLYRDTIDALAWSYFFLTYYIAPRLAPSVAGNAVGLYLIGWAIFTFYMTIAALKTSAAVLWVFITLTATYVLLVFAELGYATSSLLNIAGYVGITCGVTSWYVACAHVTNATFGKELIPTWPLNRP